MDQIQDTMSLDSQTYAGRFRIQRMLKSLSKRLDGLAQYQAYTPAALPGRMELSPENTVPDKRPHGRLADAEDPRRVRLADPSPLAECRAILGAAKEADFAIEMAAGVMLHEVLPQSNGGRLVSQILQVDGVAQEHAKPSAYAGRRGLVLVHLLEDFEKGLKTLRPVVQNLRSGQPGNLAMMVQWLQFQTLA